MKTTQQYIGTYRVFQEIDYNGKPSPNNFDTFLKCKYNSQIYRYDQTTLVIYFTATNTVNNVLPQLEALGVRLTKLSGGDFESVYLFDEKDIHKVASILKPQIKGKNISPKSVKTVKKLKKSS